MPAHRLPKLAPDRSSSPPLPLPRAPVLGWGSFRGAAQPAPAGIEDAPHQVFTSSGRAALYQALRQLRLPAGSVVLVPTYHSLTMVAPVLCAGLVPRFVGIGPDGLPELERLDAATARQARALIAAHYFGIPRSLRPVREWCDRRGTALIEDCAHCLHGQAGERVAGHWGDFSTASFSKFLPVPEAGLLASASRPIQGLSLGAPGPRAQAKAGLDVLEFAVEHGRLEGLDRLLQPLLRLKRRLKPRTQHGDEPRDTDSGETGTETEASVMAGCDMARIGLQAPAVSRLLIHLLPRGRLAARRRDNFARYAGWFAGVRGARPLFSGLPEPAAPYVFPLWVDEPEPVYRAARELRLPVCRWERGWPGNPLPRGDEGLRWRRHVLQLLCHQDLGAAEVDATAASLIRQIRLQSPPTLHLGAGTP